MMCSSDDAELGVTARLDQDGKDEKQIRRMEVDASGLEVPVVVFTRWGILNANLSGTTVNSAIDSEKGCWGTSRTSRVVVLVRGA